MWSYKEADNWMYEGPYWIHPMRGASGFDFQCLVLTGTCLSLHDTFHTCARIIRDRTGLNRIVSRTRVTFSRQFQPFRFHEYFINDFLFVFQRFVVIGAFSFVFFFFYFDLFETVNRADTIRIRNRINSEQEENIDRIIEYFIVPIYFFFFSSFSFLCLCMCIWKSTKRKSIVS